MPDHGAGVGAMAEIDGIFLPACGKAAAAEQDGKEAFHGVTLPG